MKIENLNIGGCAVLLRDGAPNSGSRIKSSKSIVFIHRPLAFSRGWCGNDPRKEEEEDYRYRVIKCKTSSDIPARGEYFNPKECESEIEGAWFWFMCFLFSRLDFAAVYADDLCVFSRNPCD
jgi:hypothetical protein